MVPFAALRVTIPPYLPPFRRSAVPPFRRSLYPGHPTGRVRVSTKSSDGHRPGVSTPAIA